MSNIVKKLFDGEESMNMDSSDGDNASQEAAEEEQIEVVRTAPEEEIVEAECVASTSAEAEPEPAKAESSEPNKPQHEG